MSRRTRALVFLLSTPLVAFVLVGGLLGASRVPSQGAIGPIDVFVDVERLIESSYVENVNIDKVFDGAMRGLADGLDPSSAYVAPDEVKVLDANTSPGPADVGIVLTRQFYLRVVGVRDNSPASRAKLESGDFIREIDGRPTRDMSALTGTRLLRGAAGSKVTLTIIRGNAADPHDISLVREVAPPDRAAGKRLGGGEAYVRVSSFGTGAADAIRSSLSSLGPAAAPGVIIDLRGTADGTADEGVAAARLFVKSGTLATRAGRAADDRVVTSAAPGDGPDAMPVVLLVSDGTANAAEIFAGALSANKRATLVGEVTAGIAGVQHLVRLPDGYAMWLTYQRYLLPDGTPIHEHGLKPDVPVDIPAVGFDETPPTTDAALDRAVQELTKLRSPQPTGAAGGR